MTVTANSIVTPQAPKASGGVCTTANTTYTDSPTNTVVIATAGANGGRLTRISAVPRATVTATQLQLYRDSDGTGTVKRLFDTALVAAYTMAQTTEAPTTDFGYSEDNALILAAGEKVYAAIGVSVANGIAFTAEWGDY